MSAWRVALLLLALVAASAQQLVAQTHWHAVAQLDAQAASPAPAAPDTRPHDDCLLCQIAAHAGAAAPPAAMQLLVLATDAHAVHIAPLRHPAPTPQPAHAWQSRGPPAA